MANLCYNEITISGSSNHLDGLYPRFKLKLDRFLDYQYLFGLEAPLSSFQINQLVGTDWFEPVIKRHKDKLYLIGRSSWSPPVKLCTSLIDMFPSLHINIKYEERGMCIGGELEVDKDGVNEIFRGSFWQYKAYQDYDSFLELVLDNLACYVDFSSIISETNLKASDIYQCLKPYDKVDFIDNLNAKTHKSLFEIHFSNNPHIVERLFADSEADVLDSVKKLHPDVNINYIP